MSSMHRALACLWIALLGCTTQPVTIADSPEQTAQATEQKLSAHAEQPLVLFDSFHAHNFLDRGLIPGEHTYHRFTGLRRAAGLLTDRQVDVQELIVVQSLLDDSIGVQLLCSTCPVWTDRRG